MHYPRNVPIDTDHRDAADLRKPDWLRVRMAGGENYRFLKGLMRTERLHTVCEEARCPNIAECWETHRTASVMILGDTCTRHCRFCAVDTGLPTPIDRLEPARVADAVRRMSLRHVHLTMVNRDDLEDGGASVMAETVRAVRRRCPGTTIEVLCSDFLGKEASVRSVMAARPDIFSHNVETVRRLTHRVRSGADYDRSLAVLRMAKAIAPRATTKSSLMLGLGETAEEVALVMDDLRSCDVEMLNIGQYLQPTRNHLAVKRYWHPDEFADLRRLALGKGFRHCEAGPLVRSSYHAADQYQHVRLRRDTAASPP